MTEVNEERASRDGETHSANSDAYTRQLEILNEVARTATLELGLRPMLQQIIEILARGFDWELVACALIDDEDDSFVCEALSTTVETEIFVGYRRDLGSGVVGEVAAKGEPIVLDDVATSKSYIETTTGARSEICVPIRHHERVIGVLNLESLQPGAFHDELPLIRTVADQVSGVIANARLLEEVTRHAELMEMMSEISRVALEADDLGSLLDRVAQFIQQRFPLKRTVIVTVSPDGEQCEIAACAGEKPNATIGYRFPIRAGVIGRAIRTRTPQLVPDVAADTDYFKIDGGVRAEYVVPISFGEGVLGALNFESMTPRVFTEASQLAFRTIADQIAGAIHLASLNQRLVEASLELTETNRRLESANRELEHISALDPLTGIPNRRKFEEVLHHEWRRCVRSMSPLALLMIDIDHFKDYNDRYGHIAGDECLRSVAAALRERLRRATDLFARYGGEEFVAVLPDTDAPRAMVHAEKLRARLEQIRIPHEGSREDCVTVSIGVSAWNRTPIDSPESLVSRADDALYRAKAGGRNRVEGPPEKNRRPRADK